MHLALILAAVTGALVVALAELPEILDRRARRRRIRTLTVTITAEIRGLVDAFDRAAASAERLATQLTPNPGGPMTDTEIAELVETLKHPRYVTLHEADGQVVLDITTTDDLERAAELIEQLTTKPERRPFPPEACCVVCEAAPTLRFMEMVPSSRSIEVDADGFVWVTSDIREYPEACEDEHFDCPHCLAEYEHPAEDRWDWGS